MSEVETMTHPYQPETMEVELDGKPVEGVVEAHYDADSSMVTLFFGVDQPTRSFKCKLLSKVSLKSVLG